MVKVNEWAFPETICSNCIEDQRNICKNKEKGCDEFYEWRSNMIDTILKYSDRKEKV